MEALRQRALQARANGHPAKAAELWRELLRTAPEDWRGALELRTDLAASHRYPESDPVFRRAARFLPDDEWLAHYSSLYTFHLADLPWLAARASDYLRKHPADARAHRLLGDVLLQQRRWPAAERHLMSGTPSDELAVKRALASLYRRLGQIVHVGEPDYAIALINLDRNSSRYRDMMRDFRGSPAPLFRVAGVEGRLLPEPAVRRLVGDGDVAMRGTLGCFLSHVSAWETMLARDLPYCLILEDDVVPLLPLPARLDALGMPAGFDLCFVNDRLQPRWSASRIAAQERFVAVPLAEAFATFPPEDNAPGTDGYVLSAAGARKLLEWVAEDGFAHDVDWRVLAYGLSEAECAALPPGHAFGVLDRLRHLVRRTDRLDAYVLHPALIRTVPMTSDREDDNRHRRGVR